MPSDGALDLNAGLSLSGTGVVQLSLGALTNNDLISGISGGTLSVYTQYVGSGGTGSFTQSGGNNNVGNTLYLGYNAGDSGSYSLSGSGRFFTQGLEYIGNSVQDPSRNREGSMRTNKTSILGNRRAATARIPSAVADCCR